MKQLQLLSNSEAYFKVKFGILLLLMVSMPFAIKVSNALVLVGVVISLIPIISGTTAKFTMNRLIGLFALFFLIEGLSLSYTKYENIKEGLSVLEKHILFIAIPLLFHDLNVFSDKGKYLEFAFVLGCFVAAIICVVFNIQLSLVEGKVLHEYYFSHDRVSEPIGLQAVYFGLYLSLCVLIILHYAIENANSISFYKGAVMLTVVIFFIVLIVASGARTAIVALVLILICNSVIYALHTRRYKYLIVAAFIPVAFVGIVLLNPVVTTRFADLRLNKTEGSNYDSYFARTNIWKHGLEVVSENIWLGVGIGDQQPELNAKFTERNYQAGLEFTFNMHNQYLQIMLGTGVVGLSVFLLILLHQVQLSIRGQNLLHLSFIALFALATLTESILNRNKGIIFFLIFSLIFNKLETKLRDLK